MSADESHIVKPPDVTAIVKTADQDGLTRLFESPIPVLVQAITGWLASGPKGWILATGHIVQGAFKGKIFQQVAEEIENFRRQGKIADNFADQKYGFQTWVELFTIIDQETPDAERLDALRAMFYAVNKVNAAEGDKVLNYQLFQISKRLSSNELLVLRTAFRMQTRNELEPGKPSYLDWCGKIAGGMGQTFTGLVDHADSALVENRLFSPRFDQNLRVIAHRVTDLGIRFCKNIEIYSLDRDSDQSGA